MQISAPYRYTSPFQATNSIHKTILQFKGHRRRSPEWEAHAALVWQAYISRVDEHGQPFDATRHQILIPALFRALGALGGVSELDILDAGCGEGQISRALAEKGAYVTAFDNSESLIHLAQQQDSHNITYFPASFTDSALLNNPALQSKRFDRIISIMALMDSDNLDQALKNFSALLKPDGKLIIAIRHPIVCRENFKIIPRENQAKGFQVLGSYFDTKSFTYTRTIPAIPDFSEKPTKMNVTQYQRTYEYYLNTLSDHGFDIIHLEAPEANPEMYAKRPGLKIIPTLLIITAGKRSGNRLNRFI